MTSKIDRSFKPLKIPVLENALNSSLSKTSNKPSNNYESLYQKLSRMNKDQDNY